MDHQRITEIATHSNLSRYLLLFVPACTLLVSQFLLKIGLRKVGRLTMSSPGDVLRVVTVAITQPLIVAGLLLGFATTLLWLVVLSRTSLSHVIPLYNGLFFVLLLASTPVVLHERVTVYQWLGAGLIVAGMWVVSRGA